MSVQRAGRAGVWSLALALGATGLVACDDEQPAGAETVDARAATPDGSGGQGGVGGGGEDQGVVEATVAITSPEDGAAFNQSPVEVRGTAEGAATVEVNGRSVPVTDGTWTASVALDEGPQTLTARAGDAEDTAQVIIDLTPPIVRIASPAAGTWAEADVTTVTFAVQEDGSGLEEVARGELPLELDTAPDFELVNLVLERGLNLIRLSASDRATNTSVEHVAVQSGPQRDPDETINGAIRLQVGPDGLRTLGDLAEGLLAERNLADLVPNPILGGPVPLSLLSITYGGLSVNFEPGPAELILRASLTEVVVRVGIGGDGTPENPPFPVTVAAERIDVTGVLQPTVTNGALVANVPEERIEVALVGLVFTLEGAPDFGDDPADEQSLLEQIISDGLALAIGRLVPQALQDVLGVLDDPIDFAVLGAGLQLRLAPEVVVVNQEGVAVRVGVNVDLSTPAAPPSAVPGYLTTPSNWNGVPTTAGIALAVDDDLLNAVLYRIWEAGVLLPTIDAAFLADSGPELALVVNLLRTLAREADPSLPANAALKLLSTLPLPVSVQVQKAADERVGLLIGLGGAHLTIATDDAEDRVIVEGNASLKGNAEVGVQPGDDGRLSLDLEVGMFDTAFDVSTDALRGRKEKAIETPMNTLLGAVGGILPSLLSDLSLPTIAGLQIRGVTADAVPAEPNFIQLLIDVAPPAAQ